MRLVQTELKLVMREPVVLTFVFAFPVITVLVLGNVFDADDTAFEGVVPAQWYVAAYIGVVIAAIGLIMLPVHIAGYRHQGVTRRFRVSLFPHWALPLAHVIIGMVVAVLGIAVLLIAGGVAYGLPAIEDVPTTIAGLLLGTLAIISVGVALGSALPNARSAQGLGLMLFLPFFLLSGGGPPPEAMGDGMQTISNWIPLTHVIRAVQEPWLDIGDPGNHFVVVIGILVAATAAWLWLAFRTES
jgi:ABC-2 type transport system permease protein